MRAAALIVVLAIAAVAFAATPSPPVWPGAFSATVLANDYMGQMRFFRWFYSVTLNKDRFDGPAYYNNEMYFGSTIIDHTSNIQYDVFYQPELAVCFSHAVNWTIPKPNLSTFSYIGKALVNDNAAYHWEQSIPSQNMTLQYYDNQSSRDPARMDFAYGPFASGTWTFLEFDDGAQDSSLFSLPSAILAQCNPIPAM